MPSDQGDAGRDASVPGQTNPHPTGERVVDTSMPRDDRAEPQSGPRRDALPDEWKDERAADDVPGLRKKIT